jgi:UDP:flavonoid glycosyltransferase YjiC (YdhE family)
MRDRVRQYAALAGRPPGQPGPRAGAGATPAVIGRLFAGMSNGMADGVVGIAERWPAEAIVQSALQGAGLIAAAKLGLPLIQHGFGLVRTAGANRMLHEHMADTFRRHRVSGLPARVAAIDVAPPSMVAAPEGWSMRYVPYNGGAVLPDDLLRPPEDRPRVAVTMGTVAPTMTGLGPVQRLIELAPQVHAQFVVALGDADTSGLGPVPHNVRLAGWVPLNALLHTSAALIHHGGAGSTLGALAAGVPQLVIPSDADRYLNGDAVAAAGAGLSRSEAELDAPLVHRLLDDPALRDGACQARSEIGSLPSPTQIARLVIDFARRAA